MKKTTLLSKYYNKLTKNIDKKLKKSQRKYKEQDYHKLRVSIKKLEALLYLVKFCLKDFKEKKYFKPVKKVFKQSGRVREFQLEASALENYKRYAVQYYLADLKERVNTEKQKFNLLVNKHLKKKIEKSFKHIHPFAKDVKAGKANAFMIKERNELNDLIQQKFLNPKQVHELRKKLKVEFYNRKAFLQGSDNLEEENNFQELLGKWHDCRILNDHLETAIIKDKINPAELKKLFEIDKEILCESENLLNEINTRIKTFTLS